MSSYTSISCEKLAQLIGTAKAPTLIDVRIDDDFAADPHLIPGATRRSHQRCSRLDTATYRGGMLVVLAASCIIGVLLRLAGVI